MKPRPNVKRARNLRQSGNVPEQIAWDALRSLRAQGFPVRRQHPIGPFIVDFAIVKAKLAIEIDGGVHCLPHVAENDVDRERKIRDLGWRVVRLSADTAMSKDHVLALMQRELGLGERRPSSAKEHPHPRPLSRKAGEGGGECGYG